jgi:hypothetical protein
VNVDSGFLVKSCILGLDMLSVDLPCAPERSQLKLALAIPTLREAVNLPALLRGVRLPPGAQRQCGLSGAILHGWRHTDAAILGVMDADLQHPPELPPSLVSAILAGLETGIRSGSFSPPPPSGPHGPSKERGFAPKTP